MGVNHERDGYADVHYIPTKLFPEALLIMCTTCSEAFSANDASHDPLIGWTFHTILHVITSSISRFQRIRLLQSINQSIAQSRFLSGCGISR